MIAFVSFPCDSVSAYGLVRMRLSTQRGRIPKRHTREQRHSVAGPCHIGAIASIVHARSRSADAREKARHVANGLELTHPLKQGADCLIAQRLRAQPETFVELLTHFG